MMRRIRSHKKCPMLCTQRIFSYLVNRKNRIADVFDVKMPDKFVASRAALLCFHGDVTSYHTTPCHVTSRHVTSCQAVECGNLHYEAFNEWNSSIWSCDFLTETIRDVVKQNHTVRRIIGLLLKITLHEHIVKSQHIVESRNGKAKNTKRDG